MSDLPDRIRDAVGALDELTPDERVEVFAQFCRECGDDDPKCQCWNDE